MAPEHPALPPRTGPRPRTVGPMPHAQASDQAPVSLQEALVERALELPGVSEAASLVSVPGARAFVLDEGSAAGPPEAFQAGREFAHLHPERDGSLHMTLPSELAEKAYERGWGEPHPKSGTPLIFGPRDEDELDAVWRLLQASYQFAAGR
ncbi:MAG: DUF5519 family protein [Actinomycetota bacterium]|nr:DUF5519 family protein [Actinomycetota bacterium]